MHHRLFVLASALFALSTYSPDAAACPGTYATASCSGGASFDVCGATTGSTWGCNLIANGEVGDASLTAVSGITAYSYSVWGTDSAGNDFCCQTSDSSIDTIVMLGSHHNDTMAFTYTSGGTTYNLENRGTAGKLASIISALEGQDTLYGAQTTSSYNEALHGDGDDDLIYGGSGGDELTGDAGDDEIWGGAGGDIIHGNDGNDLIYGETVSDSLTGDAGDDILSGGDNADIIVGGVGIDYIGGGAGADSLMGTDGNDVVCGDAGSDSLCGGADDDQLWGDSGTDNANGRIGTDSCSAETKQECESTLASKPAVCP